MKEEKTPYILSEEFSEPINVGHYYEVIDEAVEDMKGKPANIRKKMKDKIGVLMRNCNRIAGRAIYPNKF